MSKSIAPETILRVLGLPACATLEYFWEDMNFLPSEQIPHNLIEDDYGMQEALLRLANRTGLAQKMKRGWKISPDVHAAVLAMTKEQADGLYRDELIHQTIIGALEKYGMVCMALMGDIFRALNVPETVWKEAYAALFDPAYYEYYDEATATLYAVHPALEDAADMLEACRLTGVCSVAADPVALRLSADYLSGDADDYFGAMAWLSRQGVSVEDAAMLLQNAIYAMQGSNDAADMKAEIAESLGKVSLPADADAIFDELARTVPRWVYSGASEDMMDEMADTAEGGVF